MSVSIRRPLIQFTRNAQSRAAEVVLAKVDRARNSPRRVALAHQALSLWPDCARAYEILADETDLELSLYRLGLLQAAAEAGRRALAIDPRWDGEDGIGISSDGLYVLSLHKRVMEEALSAQQPYAAIEAGREAMALDPHDPLELRFKLVSHMLETQGNGYVHDALTYVRHWKEADAQHAVVWNLYESLVRYQLTGDSRKAREALQRVLDADVFLASTLIKYPTPFSDELKDHLGEETASAVWQQAGMAHAAWDHTPGALSWLELRVMDYVSEHPESMDQTAQQLIGGPEMLRLATPLERAGRLATMAWNSPDRRERTQFLERALALSDDCASAYEIAARQEQTPTRKLELYSRALEAAERVMNAGVYPEDEGMTQTADLVDVDTDQPAERARRDFLRALDGVAYHHWILGDRQQAIQDYDRLITLDPAERYGRYTALLTACLLEERTPESSQRALDVAFDRVKDVRDPVEDGETWAYYNMVLAGIQLNFDLEEAIMPVLVSALLRNPAVALLLLGDWDMPPVIPWLIEDRDETEAADYVSFMKSAWEMTPGALDLLAGAAKEVREVGLPEPDWDLYDIEGSTPAAIAEYINPMWPAGPYGIRVGRLPD